MSNMEQPEKTETSAAEIKEDGGKEEYGQFFL